MTDNIRFVSGAEASLESIADLFTRSFAGYFYPILANAEALAIRVRNEHIDLYHSTIMIIDEQPAGLALLALRRDRAWCAGFGIIEPFRGRGLAHPLMGELIAQTRKAGAARLALEVLTRN